MHKIVILLAVGFMMSINLSAYAAAGSTNCLPSNKCTIGPTLEDVINEGGRRARTA